MFNYWIRHRLLWTIFASTFIAVIASCIFIYPYISHKAEIYNSQSVYKKSNIDFIVPEPSFEQTQSLEGENGIKKVFPFYLTKTVVKVKTESRSTTVLLSDDFEDINYTMYNNRRLIRKAASKYKNSILVDWQFCKDTSAKIGDSIIFTLNGQNVEFRIYAIYETNSIYDGGAIIAQINDDQKKSIQQNSNNSGYSGMYVIANNYNLCKLYLTNDYRPLGRLKARDMFENDIQYQRHYDAIMSSGFANEITDFRVKENQFDKSNSTLLIWVGGGLAILLIIVFNIAMSRRGCEKVYFAKYCIPKGINVKVYYNASFVFEAIGFCIIYFISLFIRICISKIYIPRASYGIWPIVIPVFAIIGEIVSLLINYFTISTIEEDK